MSAYSKVAVRYNNTWYGTGLEVHCDTIYACLYLPDTIYAWLQLPDTV